MPKSSGKNYLYVFDELVVPIVTQFKPELIMVASGYDGHKKDPLTLLSLSAKDYGKLSKKLVKLAEQLSQNRIIFSLEGGYDLKALSYSILATIVELAKLDKVVEDLYGEEKQKFNLEAEKERVSKFREVYKKYWKL